MKLTILTVAMALALGGTQALAQSPGSSAGSTAGGSSAAGGEAASSTTTGSSMNGSTIGNNGPSEGLSAANSLRNGPPSNAIGETSGPGTVGSAGSSVVSPSVSGSTSVGR
jgi:hypothetical protein